MTTNEERLRDKALSIAGLVNERYTNSYIPQPECVKIIENGLASYAMPLEQEIARLREEIEILRMFGNKDCTAMADKELEVMRASTDQPKDEDE